MTSTTRHYGSVSVISQADGSVVAHDRQSGKWADIPIHTLQLIETEIAAGKTQELAWRTAVLTLTAN